MDRSPTLAWCPPGGCQGVVRLPADSLRSSCSCLCTCSTVSPQDFCGELFLWQAVLLWLWERGTLHRAMPPGRGLAEPGLSSGCQDEVHGDLDEEVPQVQGGHRKGGGLPVYELHQVSHRVLLALSRHLPEVQSKELYDVVKQAFKAKQMKMFSGTLTMVSLASRPRRTQAPRELLRLRTRMAWGKETGDNLIKVLPTLYITYSGSAFTSRSTDSWRLMPATCSSTRRRG